MTKRKTANYGADQVRALVLRKIARMMHTDIGGSCDCLIKLRVWLLAQPLCFAKRKGGLGKR